MQIAVKETGKYAQALRDKGFRATFGRVALLEALAVAGKPLGAEAAAGAVKGKLDLVNVYRALEALSEAGLVRRVDLGHQHMHYELAALAPHHHHFVCADCGFAQAHHA